MPNCTSGQSGGPHAAVRVIVACTATVVIAAGAVRAGVQIGHIYIFDYYHDALGTIATEGLPAYAQRVAKPYLAVAVAHFDPRRTTHTERLMEPLQRLRQRADMPDEGASPKLGGPS